MVGYPVCTMVGYPVCTMVGREASLGVQRWEERHPWVYNGGYTQGGVYTAGCTSPMVVYIQQGVPLPWWVYTRMYYSPYHGGYIPGCTTLPTLQPWVHPRYTTTRLPVLM